MRLTELTIENVCDTECRRIEFGDAPVTLLIGPNGCGKSTVIGAIQYLLTDILPTWHPTKGEFRRSFRGEQPEPSKISCKLVVNGKQVEIETRLDKSGSAMVIDGGDPITGVRAVAEAKQNLLGINPDTAKHVVVEQRQLHRLLYEQPAKKMEELQRLFGVADLEPARDFVRNVVGRIEAPDLSIELGNAETAVDEVQTQLSDAQNRLQESQDVLSGLNVDGAREILSQATQAAQAAGRVGVLKSEIAAATSIVSRTAGDHQTAFEKASALQKALELEQGVAEDARRELTLLESRQKAYVEYQAIQRQLAALPDNKPIIPTPLDIPGNLDSTRAGIDKQRDAYIRSAERYDALLNAKVGVCPVCGKECEGCKEHAHKASPEQLQGAANEMAKARDLLKSMTDLVDGWAEKISHQKVLEAAYEERKKAYAATEADLVARLAACEVKENPDAVKVAEYQQTINAFAKTKADSAQAQRDEAALARAIADARATLSRLETEKLAADKLAESAPTDQQIKAANQIVELHGQHAARATELLRACNQLEAMVSTRTGTLNDLRQRQKMNSVLRKFRDQLVVMREVLHRDRLPARVVIGYMNRIAAHANELLPKFGANYVVFVRDGDFQVRKTDGTEISATSLSGGEAARWCLTFLVCVHKIFAREFGLLILDEPTDGLDDAGIDDFAELLDVFGQMLASTDTQVLIATHNVELASRADRVLDLGQVAKNMRAVTP